MCFGQVKTSCSGAEEGIFDRHNTLAMRLIDDKSYSHVSKYKAWQGGGAVTASPQDDLSKELRINNAVDDDWTNP